VTKSRDDSGNRCLISEVRKVKIELRPSDISEIFQIPREATYRDLEETSIDLGKENLARILTGKDDAVWLGLHSLRVAFLPNMSSYIGCFAHTSCLTHSLARFHLSKPFS